MSQSNLIFKIALSFLPGIGAVHARNLVSYLGGLSEVFSAGKKELSRVPGIGEKRCTAIIKSDALQKAEGVLKKLEKHSCKILFYLDEDYPERLRHYVSSPLILYMKGNFTFGKNRNVGIVGTRSPTSQGRQNCEKLVDRLKAYNSCIVSGFAYGIDSVAHSRSVWNGMPTIAVLGSGLDRIYPGINIKLADRIVQNGCLLTEFPFGTKPDRENFPKRNRIIAGLSDALVVVESAEKGGSIITAEYANAFSKDVFAVPGRLTDRMSAGCNHLIKTHKAHLLQKVEDIAYICRWQQRPVQRSLAFMDDLDEDERLLVDTIRKNSPAGLEFILDQTQISLPRLSSMLLNLELRCIIKSKAGKKYILA